jgi:hypothetical protein
MEEQPVPLNLDTFSQAEYWVDRHGNRHALTDMTEGYLANVRSFLDLHCAGLYELHVRRHEDLALLAELSGWDPVRGTTLPRSQAAAEEWLENTPLVKAVNALLNGN